MCEEKSKCESHDCCMCCQCPLHVFQYKIYQKSIHHYVSEDHICTREEFYALSKNEPHSRHLPPISLAGNLQHERFNIVLNLNTLRIMSGISALSFTN